MVYLASYGTKQKAYSLEEGSSGGMATAQKTVFFATEGSAGYIHTHRPEERAHFSRSRAIAEYSERKAMASRGSTTTYGTCPRPFAQYIYRKHSKVEVDAFIEKLKRNIDLYDELAGFASEGGTKGRVLSGNILYNVKFDEHSLDEISQVEMDDEMYSGGDEIPSSF